MSYGPPAGPPPTWPGYGGPNAGNPYSHKSKVVAGLLQLLLPFVGFCGVGRLYTGHVTVGLVQLILYWIGFPLLLFLVGFLILPAVFLWTVIDGIVLLTSESRDADGRLLRS